MKFSEMRKLRTAEGLDGLELRKHVNNWHEMRSFVEWVVRAGIARCASPERDALCNNPATRVYWQDQAEWYVCCDEHAIWHPQWSGSTRWHGSVASILVDPEKTEQWLKTLSPEQKQGLRAKWYTRKT